MKKIIALILAIVMMASMSVVVFAKEIKDEVNEDNPTLAASKTQGVDITYDVSKGYVVTIPDDLNLELDEDSKPGEVRGLGEGDVVINSARLDGKEVLTVSATGTAATVSGYNWVLKDRGDAADVGYKILKPNNEDLGQGETIVSHDSDEDDAIDPNVGRGVHLNFETEYTTQAGYFTDTLTFMTAITKKTPTQG